MNCGQMDCGNENPTIFALITEEKKTKKSDWSAQGFERGDLPNTSSACYHCATLPGNIIHTSKKFCITSVLKVPEPLHTNGLEIDKNNISALCITHENQKLQVLQ